MLIIIILLSIVLVIFSVSFALFLFSISRSSSDLEKIMRIWEPFKDRMDQAQQWIRENSSQELEITSFDGLRLKALYVPSPNPKGTMVVMHGYHSLANVDFAPEAEFLNSLGYNLILPYQRGHGKSEGKYITYGFNERYDCRDWVRLAASDKFAKGDIFLAGISMGCATVLMASGLDLPSNVKGIIADCGYTSPWEIMAHVAKRNYRIPPFPLMYITNFISRCIAGFDFKAVSTIDALEKNKIPVLFIHGVQDDFVPVEMTVRNYEACRAQKELLMVPGAKHAQAFLTDTQLCMEKIKKFVEKYQS